VFNKFYQKVRPVGSWSWITLAVGGNSTEPINNFIKGLKTIFFGLAPPSSADWGWEVDDPASQRSSLWPWISIGIALILVSLWWWDALNEQ
jgi:hypothetical protein